MGWPVVALCLIQFVDVMGVTVVVTTLPAMLDDMGATAADGTLVATGYAMFFGGLLMFGARLGDRYGHRRCILASLVAFAGGSLLTAVATSVVVLGVSVLLAVAVVRFVPARAGASEAGALNLAGSVLLTGAVMLTILFGEAPWLLLGAAVLAGLFVIVDRRSSAPLIFSGVLRLPQVRRGAGGAFFNTATTAVVTLVTLHLQGALGRTPLEAAATLLPLSLSVIPGSALAARLIVRRPAERVAAAGLVAIGAGLAVPLLAPGSVVLIGAGVAAAGFGLGLASVATTGVPGTTDRAPWVAWGAAAVAAVVAGLALGKARVSRGFGGR